MSRKDVYLPYDELGKMFPFSFFMSIYFMLSILDSAVERVGYRKMKDRKQQKKSQLGNKSDSVLVHPSLAS